VERKYRGKDILHVFLFINYCLATVFGKKKCNIYVATRHDTMKYMLMIIVRLSMGLSTMKEI
jgi:hypothetical protein